MRARHLTIYLIKEQFSSPEDIFEEPESLKHIIVNIGEQHIGDLFVKPSITHSPSWASLFEGVVSLRELASKSSSTAAIFLIRHEERVFALTFGYGKALLKPGNYEELFGLVVTLNSIEIDRIRSIDKKTFDALSLHTREQSSREGTPRDFGLDVEQDLLRAVTGTPSDAALGTRLSGMDALSTSIKIALEDIPQLVGRYYGKFRETSYREYFPWIDHISEIKNSVLRDELDQRLLEKIKSCDLQRLWLAVPEIIDWTNIGGFRYSHSTKTPLHDDIHFLTFLDSFKDPSNLKIEHLKQKRVYCFEVTTDAISYKWQVYQCIYCEIDFNNDIYLLNGGKWYRIAHDFVRQVNEEVARIPYADIALPEYRVQSETQYNQQVHESDPNNFALMDKVIIPYGGGASRIEFCDLYTLSKKLIHVKKYGGSDVLSHLFAQGLVSGELFHTDAGFRRLVNERLSEQFRIDNAENQPNTSEYEIVYAIISKSQEEHLTLPFFSRINLRHAVRRLKGYGYRVSITKIPVSSS